MSFSLVRTSVFHDLTVAMIRAGRGAPVFACGTRFLLILASAGLAFGEPLSDPPIEDSRPSLQSVKGVNYLPTYAGSSYAMWSRFDPTIVRHELSLASEIGFNAVRIFLNYEAYREAPGTFVKNFVEFLEISHSEGLGVMPVLFDAWGVANNSYLGDQRESARQAYQRISSHPGAYRIDRKYLVHLETIANELSPSREVPRSGDPGVILWGDWQPSPEPRRVSREFWATYGSYIHDVVGAASRVPVILAWDAMNHPSAGEMLKPRRDQEEIRRFVDYVIRELRAAGASDPVSVSFSAGYGAIGPVVNSVDVVATQCLQGGAADVHRALLQARELSRGRPVLLTFGGATLLPGDLQAVNDQAQLRQVESCIELADRQGAGWFLWHLIEGKSPTPWAGLVKNDGAFKPAARYLHRALGRRSRSSSHGL